MISTAELAISSSKAQVGPDLCRRIVHHCQDALAVRPYFSIALSGGSMTQLLSQLPSTFVAMQVDPQYHRWLVILADERGVPPSHHDSNLGGLRKSFLSATSIPHTQIFGLDMVALGENIHVAAQYYQTKVQAVLTKTGGFLDLALLGFGPDGHTCSLFPHHELVVTSSNEDISRQDRHPTLVAGVTDSPKPPSYRITLTLYALNHKTRHVLFCGTGASKTPILQAILTNITQDEGGDVVVRKAELSPDTDYPCGMIHPQESLVYLGDPDAFSHVALSKSCTTTTTNGEDEMLPPPNL